MKFPGARQGAARLRSSVFSIAKNLHAVHKHISYSYRILMWLGEGGAIRHSLRIEDDNVGEHAWLDEPTMIKPEIGGRQRA
jgi:hypothetical protein